MNYRTKINNNFVEFNLMSHSRRSKYSNDEIPNIYI